MTPEDLQRIRSSPGWRQRRVELFHNTSVGSVMVKGQRAARSAFRYGLLNGFARVVGLPLMLTSRDLVGAQAQATEVARLRSLADAGVAVPRVLHVEPDFFVQSWLGNRRLDCLLKGEQAMDWWQRGMRTLVDVHARGQYLSQAFARNFIAVDDTLAMIDFEDDPLEMMTLEQAQARDWLAYLHASALAFRPQLPAPHAECVALLRAELGCEPAPVQGLVADAARRLRWLLRLPAGNGLGWRRHIAIFQTAVGLMLAAELPDDDLATRSKVDHA